MSSKNIKKRVNILMCATLLSTSALPVTPVFADDVSSVIEKTTSDKPANGVSDQAQQNESAISSTKIEETTMSSTATVSKENSHLEVQKKSSSSESSAPATSVIATDEAVQPTNIITDMWGTAPVSYNKVNGELTVSSGTNSGGNIGNSSIKKQDVTKIIISGDVKLPSYSANLFRGSYFPNLVVIEGSFDTSNVTDMDHMFANSELTSLDLTNWDTSKVQNSYRMFFYTGIKKLTLGSKTKFNDSPELPHIDQSSGVYTGRWERIDPVSPQSFYNGSNDFMSNYDGSFPGTYVWETKVKAADVTAKYLDENGKTISDDVVKNGNVGDSYTTEQKAIPGYTFKEIQGSASGQFTDKEQTVTYVYTKDPVVGGNVTAKYVDGAGNTLSDNVVKSGNIGDDYSTEQKAIPGYTFKEVQGSASGQFTDKEQTITYVYTKNSVTPVKPTEPGTTQTNENNTETPVKNTTNVSLHNNVSTLGSVSTTNEKSLPTTGEKPANWAVVVGGLITLTAATVLYLLKRKY